MLMEMHCVICNVGEYYDHLSLLVACLESSILPRVISVILSHNNLMEQCYYPVYRGGN